MNLNDLAEKIYYANKEKGFWDEERNVGEMLMLVTSELGEAMEAHRKGRMCEHPVPKVSLNERDFKMDFQSRIKDTFEDEIADAIIRLLDLCGGLDINIQAHIDGKLRYNKTRERLHGKKY